MLHLGDHLTADINFSHDPTPVLKPVRYTHVHTRPQAQSSRPSSQNLHEDGRQSNIPKSSVNGLRPTTSTSTLTSHTHGVDLLFTTVRSVGCFVHSRPALDYNCPRVCTDLITYISKRAHVYTHTYNTHPSQSLCTHLYPPTPPTQTT